MAGHGVLCLDVGNGGDVTSVVPNAGGSVAVHTDGHLTVLLLQSSSVLVRYCFIHLQKLSVYLPGFPVISVRM